MTSDQFKLETGTHNKLDILFDMLTQNAKTQSVILGSLSAIASALKSIVDEREHPKAPDTAVLAILTKVEGIETMLREQR